MPARLRSILACCTASLLLAAAAVPLSAQGSALPPPSTSSTAVRPASTGSMIAGAVGGGLVGMFAFIPVGNAIDRSRGYDSSCRDCTRWGAAGGAGIGATVGIAVGVHAVNHGRGRFLPVLGRTSLAMAAGWGLSYAAYKAGGEGWDFVGTVAALGIGTAIAIHTERATMPPLPAPPAKAAPPPAN